jgi:hypothetical protein
MPTHKTMGLNHDFKTRANAILNSGHIPITPRAPFKICIGHMVYSNDHGLGLSPSPTPHHLPQFLN